MTIKNMNMITPNKQALADLTIEKFGDWIETISVCNSGLFVHLSYENKCSHIYVIKSENDINRVYDEYSSIVVKAERHFQDTNILNAYLKNFRENISIANMRNIVDFCNKQGIKLIYQYQLISIMDNFRLTEKSIIALDAMDNKVIFNNHSNKNFTFHKSAIMVSKW
jgi:hypothetical protein